MFQVAPVASSISQAVTSLTANPMAVSGLNVSAVNINGRSYSPSPNNNTPGESTVGANVGLIVGLVIGLVGVLIVIVVLIFAKRAHSASNRRRRLVVEADDHVSWSGINKSTASLPKEDPPTMIDTAMENFVSTPLSPRANRVDSAVSYDRSRAPSVDISVHLSDHDELNDRPPSRKMWSDLKLIDFD